MTHTVIDASLHKYSISSSAHAQSEAWRQFAFQQACEKQAQRQEDMMRAHYVESIGRFLSADLALNLTKDEAHVLVADLAKSQNVSKELAEKKREIVLYQEDFKRTSQKLVEIEQQLQAKNEENERIKKASADLSSNFSKELAIMQRKLEQNVQAKKEMQNSLHATISDNSRAIANLESGHKSLQAERVVLQEKVSQVEQQARFYKHTIIGLTVGLLVTTAVAANLYCNPKK